MVLYYHLPMPLIYEYKFVASTSPCPLSHVRSWPCGLCLGPCSQQPHPTSGAHREGKQSSFLLFWHTNSYRCCIFTAKISFTPPSTKPLVNAKAKKKEWPPLPLPIRLLPPQEGVLGTTNRHTPHSALPLFPQIQVADPLTYIWPTNDNTHTTESTKTTMNWLTYLTILTSTSTT